jgi:hypothetical protein
MNYGADAAERPRRGLLILSGIDADTGDPLVEPPRTAEEVAAYLGGSPLVVAPRLEQTGRGAGQRRLGLPAEVPPGDLSRTGWAVVVAQDTPAPVLAALRRFLNHQASGLGSQVYHEFAYPRGYPPERWVTDRD